MSDQFRELEKPLSVRKRDVVLMATVTSFENLQFPSKSELRQFAELFTPLFQASTVEARRQAVAALSQCPNVPGAVALFIASQPISIAAPFLVSSPCLSDELLITIARTQGAEHARAIVRREQLSPTVIDALVGLRHGEPARTPAKKTSSDTTDAAAPMAVAKPPVQPAVPGTQLTTAEREEQLRDQIRRLATHVNRPPDDRLGLRTVTPMQEALLVRFARNREAGHFATTLADVLSSSRWLAERILLDISGRQLATTLIGVAMNPSEALYVLTRLYPHLAKENAGVSRAEALISGLDAIECEERVDTWRRADSYTFDDASADAVPQAANSSAPSNGPAPAIRPSTQAVDERGRQVLRHRMR
ncbi:DUF2336 domain-containing protein [Rhizobium sp. S-51]|uniref:DUF2336 domain-containing protein n=1 Tax=Rhizobium terricola TaxID=2728849 RepID=A0A7Y0B0G1_9HYPH|nr:DUF2336 domain-containing protein [Rhizobium terricola]NML76825.1 DUF2336 domain-containing protein [Rhizobium terricola]